MKKIISLTLIALMLLQLVTVATGMDKTYILGDTDQQYSFTITGVIDEGPIDEGGVDCIVIDKNSTITFNCPIDVLMVGQGKGTVLDFDGIFSTSVSYGDETKNSSPCIFNGNTSERKDDKLTFYSYENVENTSVHYINEGATIKFKSTGLFDMWAIQGMKTADERKAFEAKYADKAEKINNNYYYIYVVEDASEYVPYGKEEENAGNTDYNDEAVEENNDEVIFDEPSYEEVPPVIYDPYADLKEYDENIIYISGISHYEYDTPTVNYHDRVAVCNGPVKIEIKQDIKMFSVTPVINVGGKYILDDQNAIFSSENGRWEFDEKYGADILPAKKGEVVTLTKPGLYNVFAEKDFMGDWTELIIEITDPNATYNAEYTDSKVMVDGKEVKFEAYNIADNNYFKLRDIAFVLSGTSKQFEVAWDNVNQRINMVSGAPYTAVGGELANGDGLGKQATKGTSNISKDGVAEHLKAYMIKGNNYFKLRDLGRTFNFDVSWDGKNNCVLIDTNNPYTED